MRAKKIITCTDHAGRLMDMPVFQPMQHVELILLFPNEMIKQIEQAEPVAISAISCFEVTWLYDHKRILLDIPIQEWIAQATDNAGIICLPVSCKIASLAAELPEHHNKMNEKGLSIQLQPNLFYENTMSKI